MTSRVIDWDLNEEKINSMCVSSILDSKTRCTKIIEAPVKDESILKNLNELERLFGNTMGVIEIYKNVATDKKHREASSKAIAELNKAEIELKMNKDVYDTLEATKANVYDKLDRESKRFIDRLILERRLDGLHLDDETRNKVKILKEKISDLELEYRNNCTEEATKLYFTKEQLSGVNENLLTSFPKNDKGEYEVSLKYSDYFPIMKQCRVPETRRKMLVAFDKRCVGVNEKILEQVLALRVQLANLLGYKTAAEYMLPLLCAKNPENVHKFLDRLKEKLRPLQKLEMDALLQYKKEECAQLNLPFDGRINPSDIRYYQNIREKKEFEIDQTKLQEYFPLDKVLEGTFNIYQNLLGLIFQEVTDEPLHHPEAKMYRVKDKASQETIGHFYTDIFPRDGKFGHAAVFPINQGCLKLDGTRQLPVCMMVCNFTKPTADLPSLLTHDEVETFFHEFGHVMHNICTKANYAKFGGTSVETDFVEAPSQMLENWCWEKESLNLLASHYKDGSKIDDQTIEKLIKSKNSSSGYTNMRQVMLAKMDQLFHSNEKSNTTEIYHKLAKEYMLYEELEDKDLNMNAAFEHLMGGYEAKYYSYLWSEVYSQDMFVSRFQKEGVLSPKAGLDYRRCILEPGGSLDGTEMASNFIGREPNEDAFLISKGLNL